MIEGLKFEPAEALCRRERISIVVPVFNECRSIEPFIDAVDQAVNSGWALGQAKPELEYVFVDDGSHDGTADVVRTQCGFDDRVKLVILSRNFGKEAALSAGLKAATGDAVVPMDVDLQDPPELLKPMYDCWRNGAKVVNARRSDRTADTLFKRSTSRIFYMLINSLSDHPIAENVGDFRLLDRIAVDALNELTEHSRFNKGLFSWIGFNTATLEYKRPTRTIGETKWNFSKLFSLALDGLLSSTVFPLRVWTAIGALVAIAGFAYAGFLMIHTLVFGVETPGYASLMVVVLFLGGLNLLSVGLLGEYVGRIAKQVKGRPLYIVAATEGF